MKLKQVLLACMFAGLLGDNSGSVFAQNALQQSQRMYRAGKIIGSPVRDQKDRTIGEIKDLILDSRRGEVAYAIVNFGGVTGIRTKYHAVPWQAFQAGDDGKYYVLYADQATLVKAPGFDSKTWPDLADKKWTTEVDRYWTPRVGHGTASNNSLSPASAGSSGQ
jgi:hypothetical protein